MDNPKTEPAEEKEGGYDGPEFSLPEGYMPPEDSAEGEDIQVLAKIRLKGPGKACLVSLDGAEFGKMPEKADQPKEQVEGSQVTEETVPDEAPLSERIRSIRNSQKGAYA